MRVPKRSIHTAVAPTTRRWAFKTRGALNNKMKLDFGVDVVVRRARDGAVLKAISDFAELKDGGRLQFDVDEICEKHGVPDYASVELVLTFSLIPSRYRDAEDLVEIDEKEIYRLQNAQDHYLEHYDPATGFSSGILALTPHINDPLFSKRSSFLFQAPKLFLTEHRNTVVQVMFYSTDPKFSKTANILCRLRDQAGKTFLEWSQPISAHGVDYIDIKEVLAKQKLKYQDFTNRHGFLFLEAFCSDACFIPHTFNINEKMRTFDLEHSLPPIYYAKNFNGRRKDEVVALALQYAK